MKPPVFSCLAAHTTDTGSFYGRFLFGPLPGDISLTLATILRRSLLHNKVPFVIVSAEIEGATHEYAALPGIQESVLEILLNLGEIVLTGKKGNLLNSNFRCSHSNHQKSNTEAYVASLKISGPCIVTAKDIYWPNGIYCVKPNAHIATLSSNSTLGLRIKILSTVPSQNYPLDTQYLGVFSKHFRSISTLSFAPDSGFLKNQSTYQGLARQSLPSTAKTKRLFGKQSLKRNTLLSSLSCGSYLLRKCVAKASEGTFLETTPVPFSQRVKEGSSLTASVKKKPSIYSSVKHLEVLGVKANVALHKPSIFFNVPLRHYPFLHFNSNFTRSMVFRPPTSEFYSARKTSTFKGIIKEEETVLHEALNRRNKTTSATQEQPLFLFSGQQKKTFSLSSTLQHLSGSLKKQAIKHLSFAHLFEPRLPRKKQSKEDFVSIDPWGNELAVTSSFYPVEKVNFVIERDDQLVGHRHRIIFEVWTNGSLSPRQAIFDSINWIMKLLYSFREPTAPFEKN